MLKRKISKKILFYAIAAAVIFIVLIFIFKKERPVLNREFNRGVEELNKGDFPAATRNFEEAVKNDKNNPDNLKMLAISRYNEKKYAEAEENFKFLIDSDSKKAYEYYNYLGNIYRDQEKLEEAVKYYEKSIDENPKYETAYQNLIISLMNENISGEEIEEYVQRGRENLPESESLKNLERIVMGK